MLLTCIFAPRDIDFFEFETLSLVFTQNPQVRKLIFVVSEAPAYYGAPSWRNQSQP